MIITSVSNPQWANEEQTAINCDITIKEFGDQVLPFTATDYDVESYGRQLFIELNNGKFGPIAEYIFPAITEEQARGQRDRLLIELDAIVSNPLRWNSLSQAQHAAYATYRQDLLDVPQQPGFPTTIIWPTKPE